MVMRDLLKRRQPEVEMPRLRAKQNDHDWVRDLIMLVVLGLCFVILLTLLHKVRNREWDGGYLLWFVCSLIGIRLGVKYFWR